MNNFFSKCNYWQLSLFLIIMAMPRANAQTGNVDIGSAGTTISTAGSAQSPITQAYTAIRFQFIYTKDEIIAAGGVGGAITQLGWRVGTGATGLTNYTVKIGHTTQAVVGTSAFISGLTQVYSTGTYAPSSGYNMLTFSSAFTWNGTSNVAVEVCYTRASTLSSGGTVYTYTYTGTAAASVYRNATTTTPCTIATPYSNFNTKPQIRFVMAVPCKVPINVTPGTIAGNSAFFSWSVPSPAPASGYQYGYNTSATLAPSSLTTITNTNVTLSGLTPGTTYYFWVRSRCSTTSNSEWDTTQFTTPVVNNCAMPTNISAVTTTATTAAFSWTAPTIVPANGYYYGYSTSAATAPASPSTGTVTTATISGLTAGTGYYFWVRSRCSASSNSEWVTLPFSTQCEAPVVTPANNSRCDNGSVSLTANATAGTLYWWDAATGGNLLGTGSPFNTPSLSATTNYYVSAGQAMAAETAATIGAGSSTSIVTAQNPFSANNKVQSSQYIIKASELLSAGIGAGLITSLSLDVSTAGSVMSQFTIRLTNTTASDLSNEFASQGSSTFYGSSATSYTPVTGINSFSGTFTWDGTSNIAVNISWSNTASGGTQTITKSDTTGFNSSRTTYLINTASTSYITASGTNRPKFILNGRKLCISEREEAVATIIERTPTSIIAPGTFLACNSPAVLVKIEGIDSAIWSSNEAGSLFTDSTATIAYNGEALQQVYVKQTNASVTYTATPPSGVCATTSTVTFTIPYKNWVGGSSPDWNNAANWSPVGVPTASDCVVVPTSTDIIVTEGTASMSSVTLNGTARLTVSTGATLLVTNAVSVADTAELTIENNAALLQGANVTTNTNSGAANVFRFSNELFRLDYTLWSSPVGNQNLYDFSNGTLTNRFYTYDAATNHYVTIDPEENDFADATGYLIRMPNGSDVPGYIAGTAPMAFEGLFVGTPNNGDVPVALATTGDRYTAIGNPYPSPISVAAVFGQGEFVLDQASPIYLWRKKNQVNTPAYATLTTTAYAENEEPGGGGELAEFYEEGNEANWMLAQGQGFIVKTRDDAAQAVYNFKNSMRRPASTTGEMAFFKNAQSETSMSRFWLNIANTAVNGTSQIAVVYKEGATTGIDFGMDGRKFDLANALSLYTYAEDIDLTIQTRPAFTNSDVVPMGYVAPAAGQYTISLSRTDGLFSTGQDIFLKDNTTGFIHNLKESAYTFTTEEGTFNSRFEVVYTETPAMGTGATKSISSSVIVFNENSQIKVSSPNASITEITVFDTRGRKLYNQTNVNTNAATLKGFSAAQQVLIINVTTVKGKVSRKIVY